MKKIIVSSLLLIIMLYCYFPKTQTFFELTKAVNNIMISSGNESSEEVIGQIEITRLGIQNIIKKGISDNVIDQGCVGYAQESSELDSAFGNTILAGHNKEEVFHKLHYIKINDEIIIKTNVAKYKYSVYKKEIVAINNKEYYKIYNGYKIITLITCTKNKYERLIILAKKV